MTKEALKLALEALQKIYIAPEHEEYIRVWWPACEQAIPAIKEALAQPEYQSTADKSKLEKVPAKGALLAQPEQKPEPMAFEKTVCPFCSSEWVTAEQHDRKMDRLDQEPVVWMYQNKSTHEVRFQKHMRSFVDHGAWYEVPLYSEPLANQEKTSGSPIKKVLAQPEQEPVAHTLNCVCGAVWDIKADGSEEMAHTPDTTPPQRKPLSDEEIILIVAECASSHQHTDIHFARAIEQAHGIKGEA